MGSIERGEQKSAKERAVESARGYREFIRGQGASLHLWLSSTGLEGVKVLSLEMQTFLKRERLLDMLLIFNI
ncbi:MAG TPA: hypothetical protein VE090_03870 [Methylomirabilota bacterium]|nr:hypothetical protein [Methylomirabilota bacterium]